MAKKKNVESNNQAVPTTTPAPRLRTTRRPASAPPPETSAGLDGSPAHEPISVAKDVSNGPRADAPTFEQIAEAAYHRYLQRGGQHGQDFDDWVEAERWLRERR